MIFTLHAVCNCFPWSLHVFYMKFTQHYMKLQFITFFALHIWNEHFFTCFLHSLHALSTYFTWLLHVLHDYYMNFSRFLLTAKKWPLSFLFSASLINIHEDTRSRPSTWMVAAFYPVLGVESTWDEKRGNSNDGCRAFYAQGHQRKRPGLSWHQEVYAGVRKPALHRVPRVCVVWLEEKNKQRQLQVEPPTWLLLPIWPGQHHYNFHPYLVAS